MPIKVPRGRVDEVQVSLTVARVEEADAPVIDSVSSCPDSGALVAEPLMGRASPKWSWLIVVVPLVVVLVGAWAYRWVQEDAFINFRVIGNLVAGHGPVFNVGERVEVYSDPLWMFLLAITHEIVPFLSLEWLSVLLGLGFTGLGIVLAGRAMQRLGSRDTDGLVVPVGLLVFSVVSGVWEFATSGLEMGMVFGWIGLSFWLLVRTEASRRSAVWCAFAVGLGPLIRPELVIVAAVFLAGLAILVAAPGWQGSKSVARRWILPFAAALGLPVLYELWRMAYFGMVVSNSELAKSGAGSDVPQGLAYFWNFISTYVLWVPFLLAIPIVLPRIRRWLYAGDRTGAVLLVTPLVAGIADALYVVHVGGDYMEARLLLPSLLLCCLTLFVDTRTFRTLLALPLIGLVVWSAICASELRPNNVTGFVHSMHDERTNWILDTGESHPIDVTGYLRLVALGVGLRSSTEANDPSKQSILVLGNPGAVFFPANKSLLSMEQISKKTATFIKENSEAARSMLPFHLVLDIDNVGAIGYLAGPSVYVYDSLSLANPVGSHTTVAVPGIPGHDKSIGPEWMIARFGLPGETFPHASVLGLTGATVSARRALTCEPLRSYLGAITKPLSWSLALSNVMHSVTYTTMTFSPDANSAVSQICGGSS